MESLRVLKDLDKEWSSGRASWFRSKYGDIGTRRRASIQTVWYVSYSMDDKIKRRVSGVLNILRLESIQV